MCIYERHDTFSLFMFGYLLVVTSVFSPQSRGTANSGLAMSPNPSFSHTSANNNIAFFQAASSADFDSSLFLLLA